SWRCRVRSLHVDSTDAIRLLVNDQQAARSIFTECFIFALLRAFFDADVHAVALEDKKGTNIRGKSICGKQTSIEENVEQHRQIPLIRVATSVSARRRDRLRRRIRRSQFLKVCKEGLGGLHRKESFLPKPILYAR